MGQGFAQSLLESAIYNKDEAIPAYIEWSSDNRVRSLKSLENDADRTSFLHSLLKLNDETSVMLVDTMTDFTGGFHRFYAEYYKGVKVEGASYAIHYKNGGIYSMNGNFRTINDLDVIPTLTNKDALDCVLNCFGAEKYAWEENNQDALVASTRNHAAASCMPEGEIVICVKNEKPCLAFKFDVTATQPFSKQRVYVDAHTGDIIHTESLIHNVDALGYADLYFSGRRAIVTELENNLYVLKDLTRGGGIHTMRADKSNYWDNDNNWTSQEWANSSLDNAAFDVHWGVEQVYDFFFKKFGWKGFDNEGSGIINRVNDRQIVDNAYWDTGEKIMHFGITSVTNKPIVCLDIVSHEMSHGVTQHTARLIYRGESGALNEGLSDVWAVCIERFAKPYKGDAIWTIGEELQEKRFIRDLVHPVCKRYKGEGWIDTGLSVDNGGVHTNSGVFGYWFYTLVNGGEFNNQKVYGIGFDKAEKLCFLLQSTRLAYDDNYLSARNLSIDVAQEYFGKGSEEAIAVNNAWCIVGVGGDDKFITTSISGPKLLDNNEICTIKINNFPSNAKLKMGGFEQLEFDGQNLIVKAIGNARAFINVETSSGNIVASYAAWVGVPIISNVTYNARDQILEAQTFGGDAQITNLVWSVDGGGYSIYPTKYHPYRTQGTISVSVRGTNKCGTGPEYTCNITLEENRNLSISQSDDSRVISVLSEQGANDNSPITYRLVSMSTGAITSGHTIVGSTLNFNKERAGLYVLELRISAQLKETFRIVLR